MYESLHGKIRFYINKLEKEKWNGICTRSRY